MKLTAKQRTLIHHLRNHYHVGPNVDIHVHLPGPGYDWVPWGNLDHRSAHDRTAPRKHDDEEADV